jgi:hypothetical protein
MIVTCPGCGKRFDDEACWILCPHNPLDIDPDAKWRRQGRSNVLCQEHGSRRTL